MEHCSEDALLVPRRPAGSILQPTFCAQLQRGKLCWEVGEDLCFLRKREVPCCGAEDMSEKMGCWLFYLACRSRGGPVKLIRGCKIVLEILRVGIWSFWGSGRPRGSRRPSQRVGSFAPPPFGEISWARSRPDPHHDKFPILGKFPTELGPETHSNGSGSRNGAEHIQTQPRKPIIRPFRDHVLVHIHSYKFKMCHKAKVRNCSHECGM